MTKEEKSSAGYSQFLGVFKVATDIAARRGAASADRPNDKKSVSNAMETETLVPFDRINLIRGKGAAKEPGVS